jgi:hypothetical protein
VRCWPGRKSILYLTEIVGERSNVQIGTIADIAFNSVWVCCGTNVILVALGGYRWEKKTKNVEV